MASKKLEHISSKSATEMKEMTEEQINVMRQFINDTMYELSEEADLFDQDWYDDEIISIIWKWGDLVILDMFGYPGEDEEGCLSIDGVIVGYNMNGVITACNGFPEDLDIELLSETRASARPSY